MTLEQAAPFDPQAAASLGRYEGPLRYVAGFCVGVTAGLLLAGSLETGVRWALDGSSDNWNVLLWDDHWMWRGASSASATAGAAFLAGMVARHRGGRVAAVAAIPTVFFWALIAYIGWTGQSPLGGESYLPLGYRIVATALVVVTVPIAFAIGKEGELFGRVNANHFDRRRAALLGVRWFHFLWLPILIHFMVLTAAFGAVYGFQWIAAAWKAGASVFSLVPALFSVAILFTLQLLVTGGFKAYEALAGFDNGTGQPAWRTVLKYGLGYTVAAASAQAAISLLHYWLANLLGRIS